MSRLTEIMQASGMTRQQIVRAVGTGMGRIPPANISDARLAELFDSMRSLRQMGGGLLIDTQAKADLLRSYIQEECPVDTGALRASFSDPRSVQIRPDGSVQIDSDLPYARIQDLGGIIHRTSSAGKSYTIRIKAQHYVQKALDRYNNSLAGQIEPLQQGEDAGPNIADLISRGAQILGMLNNGR